MSYSLDSDIQEDLRTFPMYQRLRKINPYAYYSLNTQKQMQLDLRTSGSPNFFMVDPDTITETDEPTGTITLPEALAKAELLKRLGELYPMRDRQSACWFSGCRHEQPSFPVS